MHASVRLHIGLSVLAHKFLSVSYCSKRNMSKDLRNVQRVMAVRGVDEKQNDIVYFPPENAAEEGGSVVFFGGDVQDFPEAMLTHRDNKRHVHWSLDDCATLLHKKFPNWSVFVVRPVRMHLKTFSCFDNFVTGDDVGSPHHSSSVSGLKHLLAILENAKSRTHTASESCQKTRDPIILVGFSKGCVVLNQLLYSFSALSKCPDEDLSDFVDRIEDMYWLDGGHSGGSNTWVTDKRVLQDLAGLKIRIHIHVTPYQVKCLTRPWNGKEEKMFREILRNLGVNVKRTIHFEDEPHSLENHFKILEVFSVN